MIGFAGWRCRWRQWWGDVYAVTFDSTAAPSGDYVVDITAVGSSPYANQQRFAAAAGYEVLDGLFADGFESGDTSAWSATLP